MVSPPNPSVSLARDGLTAGVALIRRHICPSVWTVAMSPSLKGMSHTMPQQSNENAAISWRWLHFCCADVFWLVGLATLCTHRGTLAASSTVLPRVGGDNAPWQRAQWSDARNKIPSAPHPGRSAGYLSSTQLA